MRLDVSRDHVVEDAHVEVGTAVVLLGRQDEGDQRQRHHRAVVDPAARGEVTPDTPAPPRRATRQVPRKKEPDRRARRRSAAGIGSDPLDHGDLDPVHLDRPGVLPRVPPLAARTIIYCARGRRRRQGGGRRGQRGNLRTRAATEASLPKFIQELSRSLSTLFMGLAGLVATSIWQYRQGRSPRSRQVGGRSRAKRPAATGGSPAPRSCPRTWTCCRPRGPRRRPPLRRPAVADPRGHD